IYIRGEFNHSINRIEKAMEEAYSAGHLGKNIYNSGNDLDLIVHTGGGAYMCGEETGLINSLEGEKGMARIRPPFPAVEGLWGSPTIVNNVETLAAVTHIINRGADWFRSIGTEKSAGTKLVSLSGHINRPGNYEIPMGFSLRKFIYDPEFGNGILGGKKLKGVIPGGASTPYLTPEMVDVGLDFESLAAVGSMLGSGAVIVFHEDTCVVWTILKLIKFFRHESCGKCTPCREGTSWLEQIIQRIEDGLGREDDLAKLDSICGNILGRTICPLGDAAVMPIQSTLKHFREEWQYHIEHKQCMVKTHFEF
ncbi:MAG: complex I 51 kDa subunit family protein, partial [Candidatus Zixiibacteriota bacterium]